MTHNTTSCEGPRCMENKTRVKFGATRLQLGGSNTPSWLSQDPKQDDTTIRLDQRRTSGMRAAASRPHNHATYSEAKSHIVAQVNLRKNPNVEMAQIGSSSAAQAPVRMHTTESS